MRLTVSGGDPGARTKRIMSSLPASVGAAIIVLLLLVIAWLDYSTSTAPVQHLYYVPIVLTAIIFDYWGGLACAMTAVVFYHLAKEHLRSKLGIVGLEIDPKLAATLPGLRMS